MAYLTPVLEALGPVIIGLITVPIFSQLKKVVAIIDAHGPGIQRILVVIVAGALTYVSHLLGVVVPESLALWEPDTVSAILSAILAMAAHAGNKTTATGGG